MESVACSRASTTLVPKCDVVAPVDSAQSSSIRSSNNPQLGNPAQQFCAFCLRAKLPDVAFYKHVIGTPVELRTALQTVLGYDFRLESFSICMPCWKIMLLIQDFRQRCKKANGALERIGQGLRREDGWFSARTWETIESIRAVVKEQLGQIEEEAERVRQLELGNAEVSAEDVLRSTLDIGEVKIEVDEEVVKDHPGQAEKETSSAEVLESTLDIGAVKIELDEEVTKDQQVEKEADQQMKQCDAQVCPADLLESTLDIGEVKIELGNDENTKVKEEMEERTAGEVPETATSSTDQEDYITCIVEIKNEPDSEDDDKAPEAEDRDFTAKEFLESILDIGEAKIEGEEVNVEDVTDQLPSIAIDIESETESEDDFYDISAVPNQHDTSDLLQCSKCSRLFHPTGYKVHVLNCDGKRPLKILKCPHCPVTFKKHNKLVGHLNKHSGKTPYPCRKHCQRGFASIDVRNRHELRCGLDVQKCAYCEKTLENRLRLYEHYRLVHPDERRFSCPHCDKQFKRKDHFLKHQARLHSGERIKQFPCELCDRSFAEDYYLKKHMASVHTDETPFSCELEECGKQFKSKFALVIHNASKHPELASESAIKAIARMRKRQKELYNQRYQKVKKRKRERSSEESETDPLEVVPFDCRICGKRLGAKHSLVLHTAAKHPEQASERELKALARVKERYRNVSSRRKVEKGGSNRRGRKSNKRKQESSESETENSEDFTEESDSD